MSKLNGSWKVCMHTYMGDMFSQLDARVEGDALLGTVTDSANGAKGEIANGRVNGDEFCYDLTIRAVVGELTNHIEGVVVDENTLKGSSTNPMGTFEMEATRIG